MEMPVAIEAVDWYVGEASLRLEDGRLSGTGGINRLTGVYGVEGSSLVFGPIATTKMAGPPERMDRECRSSRISPVLFDGRSTTASSFLKMPLGRLFSDCVRVAKHGSQAIAPYIRFDRRRLAQRNWMTPERRC
jgi:hypothetical protein